MSEAVRVGGDESPTHDFDLFRLPSLKVKDIGRWREHALCKSMGTLFFFGEQGRGKERLRKKQKESAIAVCRACPVRKECFNFAKQNDERNGVWGGIDFSVNNKEPISNRVIPDSID